VCVCVCAGGGTRVVAREARLFGNRSFRLSLKPVCLREVDSYGFRV